MSMVKRPCPSLPPKESKNINKNKETATTTAGKWYPDKRTPLSSRSVSRALASIVILLQRQNNLLFSFLNVFSFQFFTKGKTRNYFCPCSRKCEDETHVENPISEWNGKNVKKMARGNRVVYILCLCKVQMFFSSLFSSTVVAARVTTNCFVSLPCITVAAMF